MNCPNCGNPVADGSAVCPACGSALMGAQPVYQQPAYQAPAKKSNTGLIVGIIIGALVLIGAIVAVLVLVVFKKDDDKKSGIADVTYYINSMTLEGQTYDSSTLDGFGYGSMSIEVDGDVMHFKSNSAAYAVDYSYTYSDGKGHMTMSGANADPNESFDFYYSGNTITVDFASSPQFSAYSEYTMDFVK